MKDHIEAALAGLREAAIRYDKPDRYYRGRHDLAFATEKFENTFGSLVREFALNLCPAVCDAVRDKLRLTGFRIHGEGHDRLTEWLVEAWRRNRLPLLAGQVHREALVAGDAYVIVWPDENRRSAIYPNGADSCMVAYDDDRPGVILFAAKLWRTSDKRTRLNIYYSDRVERYVTERPSEAATREADQYVRFGSGEIANPYGRVPFFHFANNADIGSRGTSELEQAIPVQDGMNKSVLDMLVAMEFSAYRQRWAAGIEIDRDTDGNLIAPFEAGVDHLWITENPAAKFGDFGTADLEQFLKVKDSFRVDMASVTGTPMYYLLPHTRGFPSGEAIQRAEARFIAKVRDRQAAFGHTWADALAFAAAIDGLGDVQIEAEWEDPHS